MTDPLSQLADEAFSCCRAEFIADRGEITADEETVLRKASELSAQWSTTQPAERFLSKDALSKKEQRKAKRSLRRYMLDGIHDGIQFVESNGTVQMVAASTAAFAAMGVAPEAVGFIFAFISAVAFHLCVMLCVRFLLKKFFTSPALAASICKGA